MPCSNRNRNADWVDGVRGLAALIVVTYHIHEAWNPDAMHPWPGNGYDIPWIRIPVTGPAAVAVFFILTGYVNSLAFLRKARSGDMTSAMKSLSKSALTRVGKFVPPVLLATTLDWLLSEAHAFEMGVHSDSGWLTRVSVMPEKDPLTSLHQLYASMVGLWAGGWDEYDKTMWPMIQLLQASLDCYLFLLATSGCSKKARRCVLLMLYVWSWMSNQSVKGMNLWFGIFLADLSTSYTPTLPTTLHKHAKYWSLPLLLLGATLCCIPDAAWDQARWCTTTEHLLRHIIPHDAETRRYVVSLGGCVVLLGCLYNRLAQRILCFRAFSFLGSISLPMYLLHAALLRSVLTWIVYLPSVLDSEEEGHRFKQSVEGHVETFYRRGGWQQFMFGVPIFYAVLIAAASAWTRWVDPACARAVDWLAALAYRGVDEERKEEVGHGAVQLVESRSGRESEEELLPSTSPVEMEQMVEVRRRGEEDVEMGLKELPQPRSFMLDDEEEMSVEGVEDDEKVALLPPPVVAGQSVAFRD